MTTYVKTISPPPPMPCKHHPAISVAIFLASAETRDPAVKKVRAARILYLWLTADREAKMGWTIAEHSTNEVLVQYVAILLAWRSFAIVWRRVREVGNKHVLHETHRQGNGKSSGINGYHEIPTAQSREA